MLVAGVGIGGVQLLLQGIVAFAAMLFREADLAALLSAVTAEFVDAFFGDWIDCERHKD